MPQIKVPQYSREAISIIKKELINSGMRLDQTIVYEGFERCDYDIIRFVTSPLMRL
jgi:hypothetical protein